MTTKAPPRPRSRASESAGPTSARGDGGGLGNTWPLFSEAAESAFPDDPKLNVTPFRPDTGELEALEQRTDVPETSREAEAAVRQLRESQPPVAPEWMRAARAMVAWLNDRLATGTLSELEQATLARTWTSFALGGATEPQILRVAHVVSRAHSAIRESPRSNQELQNAVVDCARVLHAGLPSTVRQRMPLERAIQVVRRLRQEPDAWAAVVEGTSELLGWTDYARTHAAAVLRAVIERGR